MFEEFENKNEWDSDLLNSSQKENTPEPEADLLETETPSEPKQAGSTYSWVNPKLSNRQGARDESAAYSEANYRTETQSYTSPQTSQGSYSYGGPAAVHEDFDENFEAAPQKKRKQKKTSSTGRKWGMTLAMAAVFGLVGGSVFTGTAYVGQKLVGTVREEAQEEITIPNTVSTEIPLAEEEEYKEKPVADGYQTMSVQQVAETCMPSLVAISTVTVQEVRTFFGTQSQEVPASGTGVIVGKNDNELLIATNHHVVAGAKSLSVVFTDEQTIEGVIKGTDSANDLAVVAVNLNAIPEETLSSIKIATMGSSVDLCVGEQVVAIGNALGIGQSVTSGYVSALNRDISNTDEQTGETTSSEGLIQTDAAINPGNSGGALLNMRGELIGINEAKYSSTAVEGMGFAIPISKAEPILENLMNLETRYKVEEEKAAYIGITMADVSSSISEAYGIPEGVCIMSVAEGSPASRAGLKKGDVITKFDGRETTSSQGLKDVLSYYAAGETITLLVQRADDGEYVELEIELTLGSINEMKAEEENNGNNGGSRSIFGNP